MLPFYILFALLFTGGSSSPLVEHLKTFNVTNIHAVLVSGSQGYNNYRHQADICHAYHVLRDHGVPDENIIVFMYDDVAGSALNPYPGKIFNIPDGPDVYEGVPKDYIGTEINLDNFLGVLKNFDAAEGKKTLKTGTDDHIFVYFADHGATGILAFPTQFLSSTDLNNALIYMNENKLYGQLTFYVEACEAGSMFENILPDNINIFATTASNPSESSYGCYCDTEMGSCLGDEYSVAWLQDADAQDLSTETLQVQYENVVANVAQSHPQEYGQMSLGNSVVGDFLGSQTPTSNRIRRLVPSYGRVNSRDIPLYTLRQRLISNTSNNATHTAILREELSSLIAGREYLKQTLINIITELCSLGFCSDVDQILHSRRSLFDHATYDKVAKQFHSSCLNIAINSDVLKYMYAFANIVEENKFDESRLKAFLRDLDNSCAKHFASNEFDAII